MQKKILFIIGPTATGKTALALELAKKYNGDILVADSRQVYKGMDVVTGKDLPVNYKLKIDSIAMRVNFKLENKKLEYIETQNGVRIWLTDLVNPGEHFSVALWNKYATEVLEKVWLDGKLPIIAGLNGLYVESLFRKIPTIDIPPDYKLRKDLEKKDTNGLFKMLLNLDSSKARDMNESDKKNPRRLIRAIEVARWKLENGGERIEEENGNWDVLKIGLNTKKEILFEKIDKRVDERLVQGALEETKKLMTAGVGLDTASISGTGYEQLIQYLNGDKSLEEAIQEWKYSEHGHVKRQFTMLKRDKEITWFDISTTNWRENVDNMVGNWYNKGRI